MIGHRFIQDVEPNDLIMIYPAARPARREELAAMFVVLSAPADGDFHSFSSLITVRFAHWHVPAQSGGWILNGPRVDYIPEEPEEDSDSSELNNLPEIPWGVESLKDILDAHDFGARQEPRQECTRLGESPRTVGIFPIL
jgi:hypothetical protein